MQSKSVIFEKKGKKGGFTRAVDSLTAGSGKLTHSSTTALAGMIEGDTLFTHVAHALACFPKRQPQNTLKREQRAAWHAIFVGKGAPEVAKKCNPGGKECDPDNRCCDSLDRVSFPVFSRLICWHPFFALFLNLAAVHCLTAAVCQETPSMASFALRMPQSSLRALRRPSAVTKA